MDGFSPSVALAELEQLDTRPWQRAAGLTPAPSPESCPSWEEPTGDGENRGQRPLKLYLKLGYNSGPTCATPAVQRPCG
jgi:hypothetical protein